MEEKHFIAYLDILGFSEHTKNGKESHRISTIQYLNKLFENNNFQHHEITLDLGFAQCGIIYINISSFSDNIILSFKLQSTEDDSSSPWIHQLILDINKVVWGGLLNGHLYRGATNIGRLYHNKNVVVGKGLTEAVEAEECEDKAYYPLIYILPNAVEIIDKAYLAEENIIKKVVNPKSKKEISYINCFKFDLDTWLYLAEHIGDVDISGDIEGNLDFKKFVKDSIKKIKDNIGRNIDILNKADENAALKWQWIKNELENEFKLPDWVIN